MKVSLAPLYTLATTNQGCVVDSTSSNSDRALSHMQSETIVANTTQSLTDIELPNRVVLFC